MVGTAADLTFSHRDLADDACFCPAGLLGLRHDRRFGDHDAPVDRRPEHRGPAHDLVQHRLERLLDICGQVAPYVAAAAGQGGVVVLVRVDGQGHCRGGGGSTSDGGRVG